MDAVRRVLKFGLGGVFGGVVGAAVASLVAPQKGEVTQATTRQFVSQVKSEGDQAKAQTEERLVRKFRGQVDDQKALTDKDNFQPAKAVE